MLLWCDRYRCDGRDDCPHGDDESHFPCGTEACKGNSLQDWPPVLRYKFADQGLKYEFVPYGIKILKNDIGTVM